MLCNKQITLFVGLRWLVYDQITSSIYTKAKHDCVNYAVIPSGWFTCLDELVQKSRYGYPRSYRSLLCNKQITLFVGLRWLVYDQITSSIYTKAKHDCVNYAVIPSGWFTCLDELVQKSRYGYPRSYRSLKFQNFVKI